MESESLAKMVELEGEMVELRRQKEDLENIHTQVPLIFLANYHSNGRRTYYAKIIVAVAIAVHHFFI